MMEEFLIKSLPNLGVGVVAVVVLYLVFNKFIEAMQKNQDSFSSYVNDNNHKTIEILTQARDNILESTTVIRTTGEVLKEVRDHLIRHN